MITLTATDIFMTTMTKNIDVCIDTTSKESRQWSLYQVVLLSMPDLKWVSVFWQLWPPYWCSISCTAMHPMATYYSTTVQHPSQMAFFSGIEKDLIIFQRIGSEWQSNDCVDTNHHFCLLQACELAAMKLFIVYTPKWCFWERRCSLKVESDRNVDDAIGIGDPAHEADHHLQSVDHQGGECVREWAWVRWRPRMRGIVKPPRRSRDTTKMV